MPPQVSGLWRASMSVRSGVVYRSGYPSGWYSVRPKNRSGLVWSHFDGATG